VNAVRVHNRALKAARQASLKKSAHIQEKNFRDNPWSFAKTVCEVTSTKQGPQFSADSAFQHFSSTFSSGSGYTSFPSWIHKVMPVGDLEEEFLMSSIVPKLVKNTLHKCSLSSSPGSDGITYLHLRKLPSTHHFLTTLYSKILAQTQLPPTSWYMGKLTLIYKAGAANDPTNFRPIALTSVAGKLFHKIIARRLESYLLSNGIIDTSTQKGFLSGVNGTFERIYSINACLL